MSKKEGLYIGDEPYDADAVAEATGDLFSRTRGEPVSQEQLRKSMEDAGALLRKLKESSANTRVSLHLSPERYAAFKAHCEALGVADFCSWPDDTPEQAEARGKARTL